MFESMLKIFKSTEDGTFGLPEHCVAILQEDLSGHDIFLTDLEFDQACQIACRRCRDAYRMGLVDGYVNGREYDAHIQGCLAEFAVAKYFGILNIWTPTINTFRKMPDIILNNKSIEVKSLGDKRTIIQRGFPIKQSTLKRPTDDIFIFVYCDIRQTDDPFGCKILGWSDAESIKRFYTERDWRLPYCEIRNVDSLVI